MEYITVKEGVKHQEPINLMEVDLQVQYGTCVSTPSGSLTYSQRNITVCPRTSFDGICLKDMDKYYLGIADLEPGSYNTTFKTAQVYSDLLVNQFQKSNDSFLWNGDAGCTDGGTGLISRENQRCSTGHMCTGCTCAEEGTKNIIRYSVRATNIRLNPAVIGGTLRTEEFLRSCCPITIVNCTNSYGPVGIRRAQQAA